MSTLAQFRGKWSIRKESLERCLASRTRQKEAVQSTGMQGTSFASCTKVKLDSWNFGASLRGVRVLKRDGETFVALVVSVDTSFVQLRLPDTHLPVFVALSDIESMCDVVETPMHPYGYTMMHKSGLGGLGPHIRRQMFPDSESNDVGCFILDADYRFDELRKLADTMKNVTFFFDTDAIDETIEEGLVPCLVPGRYVPHFTTRLAEHRFAVNFPNVRRASIMADSLNRAPHHYAQQLKYMDVANVGCTRSFWRFKFAHISQHSRRKSCFSWAAWAENVADEVEVECAYDRVHTLEFPLRAYVQIELVARQKKRLQVLETKLATLAVSKARARQCYTDVANEMASIEGLHVAYAHLAENMGGRFVCEANVLKLTKDDVDLQYCALRSASVDMENTIQVTQNEIQLIRSQKIDDAVDGQTYFVMKSLSDEQSLDAIDAFHGFYYAFDRLSEDERTVKRAKLQHYPQTTGHYVHWTSAYTLNDENIGNGEKPRYAVDIDTLPNSARNKLRIMPDGSARGKGKQAYKGRFRRDDAYDPKRQLVRTKVHDALMCAHPISEL